MPLGVYIASGQLPFIALHCPSSLCCESLSDLLTRTLRYSERWIAQLAVYLSLHNCA